MKLALHVMHFERSKGEIIDKSKLFIFFNENIVYSSSINCIYEKSAIIFISMVLDIRPSTQLWKHLDLASPNLYNIEMIMSFGDIDIV